MNNLSGQSLERYDILEKLGEGGMAIVYKAYDTRLERDVAIKLIRHDAFPPNQLENILKRFEREAKALAKLSHPNIVRVLDYGEHKDSPYLVMEYLPAGTLKYRLGKPMPWQDAVRLLIPIANALEYAHEHKVIHRDIKPSNILLTEKGQPMLTDFGIAKILEVKETTSLTSTGIGLGTPEYMAPEQWMGQTTSQSDIYSLGVVFYEMVTGRKPYEADTPAEILLKQATDPLPRPKEYVRNLPDQIERVILKAMAKKAIDRYRDTPELVSALENLLAGKDSGKHAVVHKLADETADEWESQTQTDPFEQTPTDTMESSAKRQTLLRWGTWAVAILFVAFGGYFLWSVLSNGEPQSPPQSVETSTPNPTSTTYPTSTPYPTQTRIPEPTAMPPAFDLHPDSSDYIDAFGVPMRLVPAGEFMTGRNIDDALAECWEYRNDCERKWFVNLVPPHQVYLDFFYIDKYEVTNALYRECVNAGICEQVRESFYNGESYYDDPKFDHYPVVNVDWFQGQTYCAWRGAQLPTEAQWEKAARGTDGRTYPWGNSLDGTRANFCDRNCIFHWANKNFDDGYASMTSPVGNFESDRSPYNLYDMAGNVREWVADWFSETYFESAPSSNPLGAANGEYRLMRGGSWYDAVNDLNTSFRDAFVPEAWDDFLGFRCSRTP